MPDLGLTINYLTIHDYGIQITNNVVFISILQLYDVLLWKCAN